MQAWVRNAFVTATMLLSLAGFAGPAHPGGLLETSAAGQDGPGQTSVQPSDAEAVSVTTKEGKIISVARSSPAETRVIIELGGTPLMRRKQAGKAALAAARDQLRLTRARVKAQVYQRESEARRSRGLPAVAARQIIRHEYSRLFHGLAATVHREVVKDIEQLPEVSRVWPDRKVRATLTESVPLIQADKVWSNLGLSGQGVLVAIVDTGVDYNHPDLGGCFGASCKVVGGYDFVNGDADPLDDHGHGTHVAGIVAADGAIRGVAYQASLLAIKVLDSTGHGYDSDVIAGIELALDPDGDPTTGDGADVINLSLGGAGDPNDPLCQAVSTAVAAGAVVVAAAGNTGPDYNTIESPALCQEAIAVGASDKSDLIAAFSSRGPAPVTNQIKPEVVAPGVAITSTVPSGGCTLCDPSGYRAASGTSMAAPHVSGAAALLLDGSPTYDPQQIRELLTEACLDLGLSAFTQGSGRLDVYEAATLPGLASPAALSLGRDDLTLPIYNRQEALSLTNHAAISETYGLSVAANLPPGITISASPPVLTLAPEETKGFTFELTVDNTVAPRPPDPPYAYEGTLTATASTATLRIPFAFIMIPTLEITFDGAPLYVLIHNGADFYQSLSTPGQSVAVDLPEGTYDVVVLFNDATTRVIREGVAVSSKTQLQISKSEAIYSLTLEPTDKDGNPYVFQRARTMARFLYKATGLGSTTDSPGYGPFAFSPVSSAYLFEASTLDLPAVGPAYGFWAYARDGISASRTFTNSPAAFKHIVIQYSVDPQATSVRPRTYLSPRPDANADQGGGEARCFSSDPPLQWPFREEGYYLPLPYPGYQVGYWRKRVEEDQGQGCNVGTVEPMFVSPYIVPASSQRLDAFLWGDVNVPVFSTTSDYLPLGIGPYFWFGQFANTPDSVILHAALGKYAFFFLSQTGAARSDAPLPYELRQGGVLVKQGTITPATPNFLMPYPALPTEAEIPLPAPGLYTLTVSFADFYVAGQPAQATVTANFDTTRTDPNPPTLRGFHVLGDGRTTDAILPTETSAIQFNVTDDSSLAQVLLYIEDGSGWLQVPLTQVGDEFTGNLPALATPAWVSAKVLAEDSFGNTLEYKVTPAFASTLCRAADCNDGNPCTDDSCDPATGCLFTNNSAPCDDANACTTGDVCSAGTCSGTPRTCDDGNPCTDDSCDPATGCLFTNNSAPCDDANACTTSDVCSAGTCSGTPRTCDDGNPCTDDSCDPATGCLFTNNSAPCDDANACTTSDVCSAGTCSGTPRTCDDGNPCTDDSCDPATGCLFTNNSAPCDDANACTIGDTCSGGICSGVPSGIACLDSFLCYKTHGKRRVAANLSDQFDSGSYQGKSVALFCTPASQGSGGPSDPDTHLVAYKVAGPHERQIGVEVQNEFGSFFFDTRKTESLMVPAASSLVPAPPPGLPDPASYVDHYRCLRVSRSKGTERLPKGLQLTVGDEFGQRTLFVKKPARLCVPTDKNGEGIKNPTASLTCYRVKARPRMQVAGLQSNDQFGQLLLNLRKEVELCVPSVVNPSLTTTTTTTTSTTTTTPSSACGDGVVSGPEECDPLAAPTGCPSGEACAGPGQPYSCTCSTEVRFPDSNLEAAIRATIGKPSGPVYLTDLESLTSLDAEHLGIVDLWGIENCHNLAFLRLGYNQLSDLAPLAPLTSLTELLLESNYNISDVSALAGLINLTVLWLNDNHISDLAPLAGLSKLSTLLLSQNQISDVSQLAGLVNLFELRLNDNQISDLTPLAGLTNLARLNLSGNQIADITPLAGLVSLSRLWLSLNLIADVSPLAGLTSLNYVFLDNNSIADISPLVDNTGLAAGDRADLRYNPLSSTSLNVYIPALVSRGVEVWY